jgi:hypothetical protein
MRTIADTYTPPLETLSGDLRRNRALPIHIQVMATLLLVLALPAAIMDTHASEGLYSVPMSFDHFLERVRRLTPANARLLIVDPDTDAPPYMFFRSRYDLYPRTVIMQRVPAPDARHGVLLRTWSEWLNTARHNRARYLVVWVLPQANRHHIDDKWHWALPTPPRGTLPVHALRVRDSSGILVETLP